MISCQKIIVKYNKFTALNNVSLEFYPSYISVLFGPNGAGKTTLLKVVASIIKPNKGVVLFNNQDIADIRDEYRSKIGYLSHELMIYNNLTAKENLSFWAIAYRKDKKEKEIDDLLHLVGLHDISNKLVKHYSKGMKQRLALARSLLNEPDIIIWDEPFTGIDAITTEIIINIIEKKKKEGNIIILSTHDLVNGYQLSDYVYLLNKGVLLYSNEKESIPFDKFKEIITTLS